MKKNGVICAIDVNEFDQEVVDLAASFAKTYDVDLDLLHVTQFPQTLDSAWPPNVPAPNAIVQDAQKLKTILTKVPGVEVHHHHVSGVPVDAIVSFADRNSPRLLVLGTHGRRGLQRLFGSVASKVMRRVTCPVLVIRERHYAENTPDMQLNEN